MGTIWNKWNKQYLITFFFFGKKVKMKTKYKLKLGGKAIFN